MHHRFEPKKHSFHYNVFMFYLDLDELDTVAKELWLISRNRFNVFNFRDSDHIQFPKENPDRSKSLKQHLLDYLETNGVKPVEPRVMLLTNLCTFGYQFNPVSFYYVFEGSIESNPLCCVVEVGNTFREIKPYFLQGNNFDGKQFHLRTQKHFYVSPFIDHDVFFDFNIGLPKEKMNIRIDDYKEERKIFISTLTGNRKALTNMRLLWYSVRFPFITLKVIGLIHWQAMRLWFKKIPHHKKQSHMDLQRDVHRPYNKESK